MKVCRARTPAGPLGYWGREPRWRVETGTLTSGSSEARTAVGAGALSGASE